MNKMQETISLLKSKADLNQGSIVLNAEQSQRLVDLLAICDKTILEQGRFIEEMRVELSGKGKVSREKSW